MFREQKAPERSSGKMVMDGEGQFLKEGRDRIRANGFQRKEDLDLDQLSERRSL